MREKHPRPAFTADAILVRRGANGWEVLLVRRGRPPFVGAWALPGGFVGRYEPPEDAARRELEEETGIRYQGPFELLGVFGQRGRDPRGWMVSAVYLGRLGSGEDAVPAGGDDASEARWFSLDAVPELAFDHLQILQEAKRRLIGD